MAAGAVVDAVQSLFEATLGWLLDAIFGALADLATSVLSFVWDAAEPDVSGSWFAGSAADGLLVVGGPTPWGQMVALAAPLLMVFFVAGVIQGALRGDAAGMARMALLRLPGAVLAMTLVITVTDVAIRATDEMSSALLGPFADDVSAVGQLLGTVGLIPEPTGATTLLWLVFGFFALLAAVVLVVMLFIRAALIYMVVALSPLIFAASVWESMRGGVRRMAELGLALILAKLAIAVALGLSAKALTTGLPGVEPSEMGGLATPEAADAMSMTDSFGLVIGAMVMFGVAAFMPFVIYRLAPLTEAALVEQGIASGPMRAAQTAMAFGGGILLGRRASAATAPLRSPGGESPPPPPPPTQPALASGRRPPSSLPPGDRPPRGLPPGPSGGRPPRGLPSGPSALPGGGSDAGSDPPSRGGSPGASPQPGGSRTGQSAQGRSGDVATAPGRRGGPTSDTPAGGRGDAAGGTAEMSAPHTPRRPSEPAYPRLPSTPQRPRGSPR